jgi:homoserine dehydrogenase
VALTGFGSVGQAFARILKERPDLPIVITAVADRGGYVEGPGGLSPEELLATKENGSVAAHRLGKQKPFDRQALESSDAQALVELSSTSYSDGQPGWSYAQSALDLGLDVVLASKGPLVAHWDELFELAGEKGRRVGFSATHGAPLPVVDMARFGLAGSRLTSITALFNSTTGLLLEQMEAGRSLAEAISSAQDAGVAETDPSLDVEGWDAAAKCVIVGRALFGRPLRLEDVRRKGIEDLTTGEVQAAARDGTPIKLLSRVDFDADRLNASVSPSRLDAANPLSTLRNGALGIVYDAEPIGPMFLAAYGAGGTPTAAAVIRDILSLG